MFAVLIQYVLIATVLKSLTSEMSSLVFRFTPRNMDSQTIDTLVLIFTSLIFCIINFVLSRFTYFIYSFLDPMDPIILPVQLIIDMVKSLINMRYSHSLFLVLRHNYFSPILQLLPLLYNFIVHSLYSVSLFIAYYFISYITY